MEKYLVIIILVVLAYYVHRYCIQIEIEKILKTKEGFAATSGSDADVASSINTLAQIAKDLQAGGLTVPGPLNIKAAINTTGDINTESAINAKGAINTSGVINAKGGINSTGGVINTDSDINAKGMKITKSLSLGDGTQDWGSVVSIRGGINDNGYLEFKNKEDVRQCYLMGKPDGAMFSANLRVSGDLIAQGSVIRNNPIYRNHDVAGYIQTEVDGIKAPLYYGVNFGWREQNIVPNVKRNHNLNNYQLNNSGIHFLSKPTYLTVFPNYKARLYYHDGGRDKFFSAIQPAFSTGEHANITHNNRFVHIVWVTLLEEQEGPDRINGN